MDLVEKIEQFKITMPGKRIRLFLDTSVINESSIVISKLSRLSSELLSFWLPEKCKSELEILSKYASLINFRNKASLLLNNFGKNVCEDLQLLYRDSKLPNRYFEEHKFYDIGLYVFYDPSAALEFSMECKYCEDNYIFSYDIWHENDVYPFYRVGQNTGRKTKPLGKIERILSDLNSQKKLTVKDGHGIVVKYLDYSCLDKLPLSGGEADIYLSKDFPNMLIKLYRIAPSSKVFEEKIKTLIQVGDNMESINVAFPKYMIYAENTCVGLIMKKSDIRRFDSISNESPSTIVKYIEELIAVLVELRMFQIVPIDISNGNFQINAKNHITLIDSDSFEVGSYVGGGQTEPCISPMLDKNDYYQKHIKPSQIGFSFAVFLFCILMDLEHPLSQCGYVIDDLKWNVHSFPYTTNGALNGCEIKDYFLKRWASLPVKLRQGFINEFNFTRSYDIGSWISLIK